MATFDLTSTTSSPPIPDTSEDSDLDDLSTLPYPKDLARSDFLSPNFDPQTYLSTLRNRHQSLQDLRSDLRQRSQLLNRELLDLVNSNYEEFLSLGGDLKGGEEMVEGVRVGVMGFKREVEGISGKVGERIDEVKSLVNERKDIRREIVQGRAMLEVEGEITELEGLLGIVEKDEDNEGDEEENEDEDDDNESVEGESPSIASKQVRRLQRLCSQYLLVMRQIERLGADLPFLVTQKPRVLEIRKTLLLDLATALRQAKISEESESVLALVQMHGDLDARSEGIKVLKSAAG